MKKRQRYSKEFKLDAVRLVTEQGYSISVAARNPGLNANMLGRWKIEACASAGAFRGNGNLSSEQLELRRLKAENRQLRMEREILKEATAFFAKESK